MNNLLFILTLYTALRSGLITGVFVTFSTFVMRIEALPHLLHGAADQCGLVGV
jgi:uncharacterized membrane protein